MVGKVAIDAGNLDIIDAIVAQHLLCHVTTCHAIGQGYLGKLLELAIQVGLHDVAEQGDSDKDYPDRVHIISKEVVKGVEGR